MLSAMQIQRSEFRAAAIYTLIETCKMNDVDPQAWLADVLARLPDYPVNRVACQRRAESPQKWRRKIPQLAGWRSAVDVISTSVFWWAAAAFQGGRNGVCGCLCFVADCLGDEIG